VCWPLLRCSRAGLVRRAERTMTVDPVIALRAFAATRRVTGLVRRVRLATPDQACVGWPYATIRPRGARVRRQGSARRRSSVARAASASRCTRLVTAAPPAARGQRPGGPARRGAACAGCTHAEATSATAMCVASRAVTTRTAWPISFVAPAGVRQPAKYAVIVKATRAIRSSARATGPAAQARTVSTATSVEILPRGSTACSRLASLLAPAAAASQASEPAPLASPRSVYA